MTKRRMRRKGDAQWVAQRYARRARAIYRRQLRTRWDRMRRLGGVGPDWVTLDKFQEWFDARRPGERAVLRRIDNNLPWGPDNVEVSTQSIVVRAAMDRVAEVNRRWIESTEGGRTFRSTLSGRPVRCVERDQIFPSARAVAEWLGVTTTAVYVAIRDGGYCAGYHWTYDTH